MRRPALMLQGTCSNAGKSLITAGLCRAFTNRGLAVRPFKPQNMSNNAAVAAGGGEIGRAQALQAQACRIAPSRHMNPVLLKPESDRGAQVIVQGHVFARTDARGYHELKPRLMPRVLESFRLLEAEADLVLVEGAGSPAEVNLRQGDIANMGFAMAAHVPVVLIGDIDRGGVIAQIIGTHALLEPEERALMKGYLVNRFRGDPTLFADADTLIRKRTGLATLGTIPWFEDARRLPAEDILGLAGLATRRERKDNALRIVVPRLPRIANFDDLDPLAHEPGVELLVLEPGEPVPGDTDLVLLTGSKSTMADLAALRREGWDTDILAHARRGGWVVGLCGGYQMLGRMIEDPDGSEGPAGAMPGLGLLPAVTTLAGDKTTREAAGVEIESNAPVAGYEIHLGVTRAGGDARPFLRLGERDEGMTGASGRVMGTYLHGLFRSDPFRRAFLARIRGGAVSDLAYDAMVESTLDALGAHLEAAIDLDALMKIAAARAA